MFGFETKKSQSDCPTIDPVKDAVAAATTIVELNRTIGRLERDIKILSIKGDVTVSWGDTYDYIILPADLIVPELERQLAETKTKLRNLAANF